MLNNFFSENRAVCEIMSKNVVETKGPQMTSQYSAYALRAGLARLYARTRMYTPTRLGAHMHARMRKHAHTDQYCFFTATMVSRMLLNVTLYVQCLACLSFSHKQK
jgi:hypothetical protein